MHRGSAAFVAIAKQAGCRAHIGCFCPTLDKVSVCMVTIQYHTDHTSEGVASGVSFDGCWISECFFCQSNLHIILTCRQKTGGISGVANAALAWTEPEFSTLTMLRVCRVFFDSCCIGHSPSMDSDHECLLILLIWGVRVCCLQRDSFPAVQHEVWYERKQTWVYVFLSLSKCLNLRVHVVGLAHSLSLVCFLARFSGHSDWAEACSIVCGPPELFEGTSDSHQRLFGSIP